MELIDTRPRIIFSVHGTWPSGFFRHIFWKARVRRARATSDEWKVEVHPSLLNLKFWFSRNSDFFKTVVDGRDQITWMPFLWSGNNSFLARHQAGVALGAALKRSISQNPDVHHTVIAHSHGGSVAVIAAQTLTEAECGRLTIIAMAAPFAQPVSLLRSYRLIGKFFRVRLAYMSLVIAPLLFLLWSLALRFWNLKEIPYVGELVTSPWWLLSIFIVVLDSWRRVSNWRLGASSEEIALNMIVRYLPTDLVNHEAAGLRSPDSSIVRLHAIRAPGDEASLAISTSQFFSLIAENLCVKVPNQVETWAANVFEGREKALFVTTFTVLLSSILYLDYSITGSFLSTVLEVPWWRTLVVLFFVAVVAALPPVAIKQYSGVAFVALAACVLVPSQIILSLALGTELLTCFGLLEAECEPIPSGFSATLHMVGRTRQSENGGLIHGVHRRDDVRELIASLL